jgi:signal transduction histidine kinase
VSVYDGAAFTNYRTGDGLSMNHLTRMLMERRRHFWLIFKEMVTNAAKHSQCTEVKIQLAAQGKLLCLRVQDNGIGLGPELRSNGNGVQSIRARAQSLQADLDLQTSRELGTRWEMKFQF